MDEQHPPLEQSDLASGSNESGSEESILNPSQVANYVPVVGTCLNCATPIAGNFCHNCGQEATDRNVQLLPLVKEIVGDYAGLDSIFLRTVKKLIRRPGELTAAYNRGERVRYLMPVRLYFLVSIIFFFVYANFDPIPPDVLYTDAQVSAALKESGTPRDLFDERWGQKVENTLVIGMLFVIPLFTLAMKLLYVGSKRYLVEHLIFSFHLFSFFYICWIPAALFANQILYGVGLLVLFVYLGFALRRVYRQGWGITILKTVLLSTYLTGLFIFYIGVVLALAYLRSMNTN